MVDDDVVCNIHSNTTKLDECIFISEKYEKDVVELLQFASQNEKYINETYYCPCAPCLNQICQDLEEIIYHMCFFNLAKSF